MVELPYIRPFVEKRAGETFSVGLAFSSPELSSGETITDVEADVTPVETGGVVVESTAISGLEVSALISGGVAGNEYQVEITAGTSAHQVLIGNILIRIIY